MTQGWDLLGSAGRGRRLRGRSGRRRHQHGRRVRLLITFPTLVALGYPPVVANVSNNIGLVPGGVTGAIGYRKELEGQRGRLLRLATASCAAR